MLFHVPKLEEDVSDLVRKHTPKQCGNNSACDGMNIPIVVYMMNCETGTFNDAASN